MSAAATLTPATSPVELLAIMMRSLKLPAFARYAEEIAQKTEREGWTFAGTFTTSPSSRSRSDFAVGSSGSLFAPVARAPPASISYAPLAASEGDA